MEEDPRLQGVHTRKDSSKQGLRKRSLCRYLFSGWEIIKSVRLYARCASCTKLVSLFSVLTQCLSDIARIWFLLKTLPGRIYWCCGCDVDLSALKDRLWDSLRQCDIIILRLQLLNHYNCTQLTYGYDLIELLYTSCTGTPDLPRPLPYL